MMKYVQKPHNNDISFSSPLRKMSRIFFRLYIVVNRCIALPRLSLSQPTQDQDAIIMIENSAVIMAKMISFTTKPIAMYYDSY